MKKLNLQSGNDILAPQGGWSFEGLNPQDFDVHLRHSIPNYHLGLDLLVSFSEFFVFGSSRIYDLGCSTGAVLSRLSARVTSPLVKMIGIDTSHSLIDAARLHLKNDERVRFECCDAVRFPYLKAKLVTAYYTLQFIPYQKRWDLVATIFRSLEPGGGFIIFDKVTESEGSLQDQTNQIYMDFKRAMGYRDEEIMNKARSLKGVLHSQTREDNFSMFLAAGFEKTQLIYKFLGFEGYLCRKPNSGTVDSKK